ncbi:unnamed protein product, partial [Lampetra fluviatilis]
DGYSHHHGDADLQGAAEGAAGRGIPTRHGLVPLRGVVQDVQHQCPGTRQCGHSHGLPVRGQGQRGHRGSQRLGHAQRVRHGPRERGHLHSALGQGRG